MPTAIQPSESTSVAALVFSTLALGSATALLILSASERLQSSQGSKRSRRRKQDSDDDDADDQAMNGERRIVTPIKRELNLFEDERSGQFAGFSMKEALEFAESGHEAAKNRTPAEVLSDLQKGNARFWTGAVSNPEKNAFERRALISKQYPLVAILACSDSRVPTEIVFDQGLGDMFVIRVAGNVLETSSNASLQYAVNHLKVKVVMVMGHEGCGAVKAAQMPMEAIEKEPRCLGILLKGMRNGLNLDILDKVKDSRVIDREAVTTNVKRQVEGLTRDANTMEKVKAGELMIIGAFYEISSGIVDFFHEVSETVQPDTDLSPMAHSKPKLDRMPSRGVLTRFGDDSKLVS